MELPNLLEMEMEGEYGQTGGKRERGEMLVTGKKAVTSHPHNVMELMIVIVSANEETRDKLRDLVQANLDKKVRLLELEFQPSEKGRVWGRLFSGAVHNY